MCCCSIVVNVLVAMKRDGWTEREREVEKCARMKQQKWLKRLFEEDFTINKLFAVDKRCSSSQKGYRSYTWNGTNAFFACTSPIQLLSFYCLQLFNYVRIFFCSYNNVVFERKRFAGKKFWDREKWWFIWLCKS